MVIVSERKDDTLLRERVGMAIVRLRKDVILLREGGTWP